MFLVLNQQLENKIMNLDAYRNRILELEHAIGTKDDLILSQKQLLCTINEEKFEKLEVNNEIRDRLVEPI